MNARQKAKRYKAMLDHIKKQPAPILPVIYKTEKHVKKYMSRTFIPKPEIYQRGDVYLDRCKCHNESELFDAVRKHMKTHMGDLGYGFEIISEIEVVE